MQVLRTATCVGETFGGDSRRSLLGLGEAVVEEMRWAAVRVLVRTHRLVPEAALMLEELEGVGAVAVGVHRSLEGGAEAVGVEGLALLEEVSEAAVEELTRRLDLTIPSSDSRARPLSMNRHCPDANGTLPSDCYFEGGLAVVLPLAERSSPGLEPDLLAAAPVAHARTLLHAPWLLLAASQVP